MSTGSYIDGEWITPASERRLRNVNPADTDDLIAEFPLATAADAERAIAAADRAFASWRRVPAPERGRVLWRVADLARERAEEIARTMTREEGKVLAESRGEVAKGIALLEYYAGAGFRLGGRTLPSEAADTFTYTLRQPLGPVGLIAPWNFPWAIPVWKAAPAIVAGNTVVLKPATLTPATASLLVELFAEAGLPAGVLNMVVGSGREVGEAIVASAAIRAVSFTGSNAIGQSLYAKAASRGIKVTCEMGGKNPVIVMPDADLDKAAVAIHGGAFGSTGQRCTATSRVVAVGERTEAELIERLTASAEAMVIGPGLDESSQLGPAVDEDQLRTDLDYVEIGRREGARLVTGGGRPQGLDRGYFVQPTIFDRVTPGMRIFREEIFGPVLAISRARDLERAIEQANAVDFGLTTSIFTRDIDAAMRYVDAAETGMVHVNEPTVGGEAQLPFGGIKATGIGDREMSEEGVNFFTELKTVFVNYSGRADRSMLR
ncbi:MAG: aldehyde dehydrogenase family protein [Thermoanaerobaculia bacterium]|nr:aldehyde dehydrogenase family protein [Thermoanaerobaculia bacterium]